MPLDDLVLLVADKNMEYALKGILKRPESLSIRPLTYKIERHSGRDGGVRTTGPETLALSQDQFQHGILMLDWEGSGTDTADAIALERELDERLERTWGDRAKTIVIHPELDIWIWGSDNALSLVLDWSETMTVRDWLRGQDHTFDEHGKPTRPKEAIEKVLVKLRRPRSSTLYEKATSQISLEKCVDPAFIRFKETLRKWFAIS